MSFFSETVPGSFTFNTLRTVSDECTSICVYTDEMESGFLLPGATTLKCTVDQVAMVCAIFVHRKTMYVGAFHFHSLRIVVGESRSYPYSQTRSKSHCALLTGAHTHRPQRKQDKNGFS